MKANTKKITETIIRQNKLDLEMQHVIGKDEKAVIEEKAILKQTKTAMK